MSKIPLKFLYNITENEFVINLYSEVISTVITGYGYGGGESRNGSMDASVTIQGGSYDHQSQP
ncbi:MAG: hypothetical protein FWC22_05335 [Treponema sp.]|nr:hypothetical protein [Treponema sp.]